VVATTRFARSPLRQQLVSAERLASLSTH